MKAILSPSLLSADFARLGQEVGLLEKAGISWLHLDIMDGVFVPNITFGAPLIASLRRCCHLFFDCHLMIEQPERHIAAIAKAGADLIVIHREAVIHPQRILEQIHEAGPKAGLALNPGTSLHELRWLLPYVDMILLMGVNPGFSGQKFLPETVEKTAACRQYLIGHGAGDLPLQVDGGVNEANCAALAAAGATILVSGSAFFRASDYCEACARFEKALAGATLDEFSQNALSNAAGWRPAA